MSIIVPCRNEAGHVEQFAASALAQRLPDGCQLEVIVADGQSNDGTQAALAAVAAADPRLRVIANPARIVSAGLNHAIAASRGEFIVRMDVHTTYASDYVAECVAALTASGADNVGGPWRASSGPGSGAMQQAIAAAFQSPWVAGGAFSRRLDYDGWADTVYLGAWPRASFDRFGGFDESLVRNQDDEHNLRITRGGGRIWQASRIRSAYRPRARLMQVLLQYVQYGYWKPFVMKKHRQPAALRHLVPAALVLGLAAAFIAALTGFTPQPLVLLTTAYGFAVLVMCAAIALERRDVGRPPFAVLGRLPVVIVAYHLGYGIGSLAGWADVLLGRVGRARFAKLTR